MNCAPGVQVGRSPFHLHFNKNSQDTSAASTNNLLGDSHGHSRKSPEFRLLQKEMKKKRTRGGAKKEMAHFARTHAKAMADAEKLTNKALDNELQVQQTIRSIMDDHTHLGAKPTYQPPDKEGRSLLTNPFFSGQTMGTRRREERRQRTP